MTTQSRGVQGKNKVVRCLKFDLKIFSFSVERLHKLCLPVIYLFASFTMLSVLIGILLESV